MSDPIHGQEIGPDGHPLSPDPVEQIEQTLSQLPEIVRVDPDELTIGEAELVEEMAEQSIDMFGRPGTPKAKFMRAMGYVKKRRTDPNFTWEQSAHVRVRVENNTVPPTSGNGSDPSQSLPGNTA